LVNGIVKKEINLENIGILKSENKIVVTGPHRAGTTISAIIIADILKYRFVNEDEYDGNDPFKFMELFINNEKMVIHNTSFLRDMHLLNLECIVLVKRKIKSILESYKNSIKFGNKFNGGKFTSINKNAEMLILKHFGKTGCLPKIAYNHFERRNDYYEIEYDSLKSHYLFITKDVRRSEFTHLKQTEI
jgi:hypothetical protein